MQVFTQDQADWFLAPQSTPVLLSRAGRPWGTGGLGAGHVTIAPDDLQSTVSHGEAAGV